MTQALEVESTQTTLLATFFVRDGHYALDAAEIQEIIRLAPLTPVHHAPAQVVGIMNLRGKIVTVLDLGLLLGFGNAACTANSRLIVMESGGEFIGLLVDGVSQVVEVASNQWQSIPANTAALRTEFLRGVCRTNESVFTVIDADRVVSAATA